MLLWIHLKETTLKIIFCGDSTNMNFGRILHWDKNNIIKYKQVQNNKKQVNKT